ncbi:MAG: 50S ribosomal protein L10 [Oscillospiraceae bacterium]|nr:50S ribosomal protein L10 [Oscillospiraceae bacterium]
MPNAQVLEQKKQTVSQLTERMKRAPSGVLADYKGISVEDDTNLRNDLRKAGVEYSVVKNTLMRLAIAEVGLGELESHLSGTTSLATAGEDMVAPAKVLCDYAKKSGGKFTIKSGFIEGKAVDCKQIEVLAGLPSKQELIARALAGFNSPISGFANVLNGNLRGLAVALGAIAKQKSS